MNHKETLIKVVLVVAGLAVGKMAAAALKGAGVNIAA